jgi:hypothetical protein
VWQAPRERAARWCCAPREGAARSYSVWMRPLRGTNTTGSGLGQSYKSYKKLQITKVTSYELQKVTKLQIKKVTKSYRKLQFTKVTKVTKSYKLR